MAQSWMAAKVAKMKPRNVRFIESGSTLEARVIDKRPCAMPESKHSNDAIIADYLCNGGMVKRLPCKGRVPKSGAMPSRTRQGLNLNPISERAARERAWDFAPKGLLRWSTDASVKLITR